MRAGVDEAEADSSVGREAEFRHVALRPLLASRAAVGKLAVVDRDAVDEAGLGRRRNEALRGEGQIRPQSDENRYVPNCSLATTAASLRSCRSCRGTSR